MAYLILFCSMFWPMFCRRNIIIFKINLIKHQITIRNLQFETVLVENRLVVVSHTSAFHLNAGIAKYTTQFHIDACACVHNYSAQWLCVNGCYSIANTSFTTCNTNEMCKCICGTTQTPLPYTQLCFRLRWYLCGAVKLFGLLFMVIRNKQMQKQKH